MINVEFPRLYPWQQEVFNDIINDDGKGLWYITKGRRQCGKSIVVIYALLYFAVKRKSIGVCVEPTQAQCRRVYKQILNAVGGEDSEIIKGANATLLEIEFINGSQIIFKSAESSDAALRGMTVRHSIMCLDESAYLKADVFRTLYPVVDAMNCPVLMISTPLFESGEFYERYTMGKNGSDFVRSYDWAKWDTSALLPPEKLEYYRQTLPPLKFRSEYLGEFITEQSFVFGNFSKNYGYSQKQPTTVGIDWATGNNEKDDYSCLVFLDDDCKMTDIRFFKVVDPMEMVDTIAALINSLPSIRNVTVEQNSIGEVYKSALKRKLTNKAILHTFTTTNDSKRRITEQLIQAFGAETITIMDDERLNEQLQHYEIESTPTGKVTYNAMSGYNDDAVMALAIAYDAATGKKNNKFQFGFA